MQTTFCEVQIQWDTRLKKSRHLTAGVHITVNVCHSLLAPLGCIALSVSNPDVSSARRKLALAKVYVAIQFNQVTTDVTLIVS